MTPPTGPTAERKWLSIAEAAEQLGLGQMTLYRVIAAGRFPAVRISEGRIVVPARALDELAERAVSTGRLVDAAEWAGARE
ncbi:MAG: helix-turn-helix domain-containing protein [Micromonosporaceae bacterium]